MISSNRSQYLEESKSAGIGISTTGLHGSVPWKLFEYFAGSKVVISQRNDTVLRFPLRDGIDYLAFDTVDQALAQCESVLSDSEKFNTLRVGASDYYANTLRPSVWAQGILKDVQDYWE